MLPLYNVTENEKPGLDTGGNAGLWFGRFFDAYPEFGKTKAELNVKEKEGLIKAEKVWLEKFCRTVGDADQLKRKALQQVALSKALGGNAHVYKTQWHFVTGMGIPHPIENGLIWRPTLGVPYLPGAAVKGIVRTWLEAWGGDDDTQKQKERLLTLFGSDDKDPEKQQIDNQAGGLIFFDALPVFNVRLGIDVMTPHMGDWYAQGNKIADARKESNKIPADWHDPVPVKYLVVKEAKFLFSIAPRNKKYIKEFDGIMNSLDAALHWLGAGAKTAVSYGLMSMDEQETQHLSDKYTENKQQEQQRKSQAGQEARMKESLSELAFKFYKQSQEADWEQNKDAFCRDFNGHAGEDWLGALKESRDQDLLAQITHLLERHFVGIMVNPDKMTQGKKTKSVYKDWIRKIAIQLNSFR